MPPKIIKDLRGDIIAPYNLPPSDTKRWTPQKKSVVVLAVQGGMCPLQDVLDRYHMTEAEFRIWQEEMKGGLSGLRITKHQQRRRNKLDGQT